MTEYYEPNKGPDPIKREIFRNLLGSVAEEMGVTLQRTGFSPNIKERRDFSCCVFDPNGDMVALAAHIPVHLGSSQETVKYVLENLELEEGDSVILNDPYHGGTHLPDITLISPVFYKGERLFFVANRAHHSDIGGVSPGSMPLATSIEDEGIVISPKKLVKKGQLDRDLLDEIANSTRTPKERFGDLRAQLGANKTGVKRLNSLADKYGPDEIKYYMSSLMDHSERMVRSVIDTIPDGEYLAEDVMDDDGFGAENITIKLKMTIKGSEAKIDFTGTSDQVQGGVNAVKAITYACVFYVFRSIAGFDIPANSGIFRPLDIVLPKHSLVDAEYPAPVVGGNVETSQRIADVILRALAEADPEMVPAAGQGTMNNVAMGGEGFAYYETLGGGTGGSINGPGESGVHVHMTNTLNTPIESIEHAFPLRIVQYKLRENSGGEGQNRGGDGLIREYRFLEPVEITIISERRNNPPWGLAGGESGMSGRNIIVREHGEEEVGPKANVRLKAGEGLRVETPGGGGYGKKK